MITYELGKISFTLSIRIENLSVEMARTFHALIALLKPAAQTITDAHSIK